MASTSSGPKHEGEGFLSGETVDVREMDDVNWSLLRQLDYQAKDEVFHVPVDELTDFASVPRIFVWFLPRYGRYTKAAILHDYLCRRKVPDGVVSRLDADGIFRRAMRDLEVPFLRRWIMWAAVRWGAVGTSQNRKGWGREAWRVLPISLFALLFVLIPGIVVLIFLLAFHLTEWLTWVPLELARRSQVMRGKPAKAVHRPQFHWKT